MSSLSIMKAAHFIQAVGVSGLVSRVQAGMSTPAETATAFRMVGAALDSYAETARLSDELAELQSSLHELPRQGIVAADLQGVILKKLAAQEGAVHQVLEGALHKVFQAYSTGSAVAIGAPVDLVSEWVWIPPGECMMGSPEGVGYINERPFRAVMVGGFWILKRLVNNAQFAEFLLATGRRNERDAPKKFAAPDQPAVYVMHHEAIAYGEWRAQQIGQNLGLSLVGGLPSEAQWEKAAKGPQGDEFIKPATRAQAHFDAEATRAVRSPLAYANGYGLYDMIGNIAEWTSSVWEWEEDRLKRKFPAMVARGGNWHHLSPRVLRAACRRFGHLHRRSVYVGLRPVVTIQDSRSIE